ncbi:MAG: UvrB/UvrC motif-containing protein [Sedimentisphaerales bacterium]|nr:UvrB/UvrC motif-containing protein [Sedimentisphaerales bacterium]
MQCQICNNRDATIHLTEITDGARSEMHICEQCAAEQGIAVKSHIPINELLSSLLAAQPADDELSDPSEQEAACPICGFTLDQFRKEGVLGCPNDYEVFAKSLQPLIERAHCGKIAHSGKLPSRTSLDTKKQVRLLNLRRQLELAVRNEDYELAAKLRDNISENEK